jgi:hypothetical protein
LVTIWRPRIAPVAIVVAAVSKTEAKTETKTDPWAEAPKAWPKAVANKAMTGKTATEASAAEVNATSTASECQSICRNCCGAEETDCGERDSYLTQHDATPYRPACWSNVLLEMDPLQLLAVVTVTICNTVSHSNIDFQLVKIAAFRHQDTVYCVCLYYKFVSRVGLWGESAPLTPFKTWLPVV